MRRMATRKLQYVGDIDVELDIDGSAPVTVRPGDTITVPSAVASGLLESAAWDDVSRKHIEPIDDGDE